MEILTVAVLGCGFMGQGIARVCAAAGLPTTIYKITPGDLTEVRRNFESGLQKEVEKASLKGEDLSPVMAAIKHNLSWGTQKDDFWESDMQECDLVIESIVEDLYKKLDLFMLIDIFMKPSAIFASNTSTLSIANLARATSRLDRFIGLHFFSPVATMGLVELVMMKNTTNVDVLVAAEKFVLKLGKTSVPVWDTPGFYVNRLLVPYLLDAIRVFEGTTGLESMMSIDKAMKLGCNHPMGPLALCDYIGLDVVLAMAKILHTELKEERFAPPASLEYLVAGKMLGKKSEQGYYDYTAKPARPNPSLAVMFVSS